MSNKTYQTTLSNQSKNVCAQLKSTGFIDEVETVLISRFFNEFTEDKTMEELGKLRDKVVAVSYILNLFREEAS